MTDSALAAVRWDEQYRAGRYVGEAPVAFINAIAQTIRSLSVDQPVLYIGCGNGRNYVPLVEEYGLDLFGLDISATAIESLRGRMPERANQLIHGDISTLPDGMTFGAVIGIQVFQHGTEAETYAHLRSAIGVLRPGGLFCVRVNAVGTEIEYRHRVVETNAAGGFTIEYQDGPKQGLNVHFFARAEIESLTNDLKPIVALDVQRTERKPPAAGHWDQWEGIWQKA